MKKTFSQAVTRMNALLCLCVILLHLTSNPVVELTPFHPWHILMFLLNKTLVFAVPGFLFLSGLKLYRRYSAQPIDPLQFYRRRITKIFLPYVLSVSVYFVYYYAKNLVSLRDLPIHIFLGTLASHFYYVIIALQFYLLFPLLKKLVDRHPVVLTLVSMTSTLTFYQFIHFPYSDRFAGTYLFYFVLGMLFAKYSYHESCQKFLPWNLIALTLTAIAHFYSLYQTTYGTLSYSWANAATVLYATLAMTAVYSLLVRLSQKHPVPSQLTQSLSQISYPIYLYHLLMLMILQYDIFPRFSLTSRYRFLISLVCLMSLVYLCTRIHQKRNLHKKSA